MMLSQSLTMLVLIGSAWTCSIPTGYVEEDHGGIFKYSTTPKNLFEAKTECEADGGNLATFKTDLELMSIMEAFPFPSSIWVGVFHATFKNCKDSDVNKINCTDEMYWSDGSLASEIWNLDRITDVAGVTGHGCLLLHTSMASGEASGNLYSGDCDLAYPFVCRFQCQSVNHQCSDSTPVDDGFEPWNGKYYMAVNTSMDFNAAKVNCESHLGTLAMQKTRTTYLATKLIVDWLGDQAHVGLTAPNAGYCTDMNCDGKLRWIDDSIYYHNFSIIPTISVPNQNCLKMSATFALRGGSCSVIMKSVCELDCGVVINGGWGLWSSWSDCPDTTTSRTRTRECNQPKPVGAGATCVGPSSESDRCPAVWMPWSSWSNCSTPCGYGVIKRSRSCTWSGECSGASSSLDYCIQDPCSLTDTVATFSKHTINSTAHDLYKSNATHSVDLGPHQSFAHKIICSNLCTNLRVNATDFMACNSFLLEGSTCHFGFADLNFVATMVAPNFPGFHQLFLDFNLDD